MCVSLRCLHTVGVAGEQFDFVAVFVDLHAFTVELGFDDPVSRRYLGHHLTDCKQSHHERSRHWNKIGIVRTSSGDFLLASIGLRGIPRRMFAFRSPFFMS